MNGCHTPHVKLSEEDLMGQRFGLRAVIGVLLLMATMTAVGSYSYNLDFAHGVAESGRTLAAPGAGVPLIAVWPRPWGFGFGFFPFFPLLFILFWFVVLRGF